MNQALILFLIFLAVITLFGVVFFGFVALTPAPSPPVAPNIQAPTEPLSLRNWSGYLVDALAKPLPGGTIRPYPVDEESDVLANSDDNGRFDLIIPVAGDDPDTPPFVEIRAPGYYRQILQLSGNPEARYQLFRGGTVSGAISVVPDQTGGSNEPVPGASLEIAGGEGWFDRVTADDGGEYRFDAPPGPVVVTVRSDTCGDQRIHDLVIRRDEEIRHDVLLHRGCRVELIVMSSAGATAGAATRVMVTALDERVESVSGEDGHAIHDGLTPGPGKYAVVASGFREVAVDILIPASRTLVRKPIFLERAPTWSLEVVDPEGKAMPEAFVIIRRDRDPIVSARAKEKEKLQVLDPTRTYSIEVSAEGFARVRKSLEIDADGSTTLGVQLMRGGRISGRMLDFRQQPVPGAQVLISSRNLPPGDKPVARLTTTARDGSFRTTRFAPGSYRVQMSTPRLGRVSVDIVIRDGEDSILGNIVLKPPGGG